MVTTQFLNTKIWTLSTISLTTDLDWSKHNNILLLLFYWLFLLLNMSLLYSILINERLYSVAILLHSVIELVLETNDHSWVGFHVYTYTVYIGRLNCIVTFLLQRKQEHHLVPFLERHSQRWSSTENICRQRDSYVCFPRRI